MKHQELVEAAKRAVSALHQDRSVGLERTIESLEEIASDINIWVDALKEDKRRQEEQA